MDTMGIFPHDESCLEFSGSPILANRHAKNLCVLVQIIFSELFFPISSPWSSKRQSQNKQQAWELSDFAKATAKNLCSLKWQYAAH